MASKVLDKLVAAGRIQSYDDERGLDHGYIVYLHSGKQWSLDPTSHTRGFDTVAEVVCAVNSEVIDYPSDPELNQNVMERPKGATHFNSNGTIFPFEKHSQSNISVWDNGEWVLCNVPSCAKPIEKQQN
jgi:hypothetical protein